MPLHLLPITCKTRPMPGEDPPRPSPQLQPPPIAPPPAPPPASALLTAASSARRSFMTTSPPADAPQRRRGGSFPSPPLPPALRGCSASSPASPSGGCDARATAPSAHAPLLRRVPLQTSPRTRGGVAALGNGAGPCKSLPAGPAPPTLADGFKRCKGEGEGAGFAPK